MAVAASVLLITSLLALGVAAAMVAANYVVIGSLEGVFAIPGIAVFGAYLMTRLRGRDPPVHQLVRVRSRTSYDALS